VSPYEQLVDEARRIGWSAHLLISPVSAPSCKRHSSLSALVLLDSTGEPVAVESLLHDDRLDVAAGYLLGYVTQRRAS
jgi:hypothetical protein